MKQIVALSLLLTLSLSALAGGSDDSLLTKVSIDKMEVRKNAHGYPLLVDGDAWIGKDLNKLWVKGEAEYVESMIEELEVQLLYSRAISAFWDVQIGWRRDLRPNPDVDWLALSLNGVAPLMLESDISLFVDMDGRVNLRIDAEYELMLTQRLVLIPEVEANAYSKASGETSAGLSDVNFGLRLGYEFVREFAPYVGVNWSATFSHGDMHSHTHGSVDSEMQLLAGVKIWF